jgi:ketosteroid isomerase-like protein
MDRAQASELLEALHAALAACYAGGSVDVIRKHLTEDVAWHVPGNNAIAGDYEGVEGVLEYFGRRRDLAGGSLRLHPGEMLVGDNHVAVLTDGTAVIAGAERRWATVGLYRIEDARVAECWLLPLDPTAFDATWSAVL